MHSKYEAVEHFRDVIEGMQADKYHRAKFDNGVGFFDKYAFVCNDIVCGRVLVKDNAPCKPLYWSLEDEISVDMPKSFRDQVNSFPFLNRGGKVVFLRKKDIARAIPKLTPLKKCVSNMRIIVNDDTITLQAVKQGIILSQEICEKYFCKFKKVNEVEDFQGIFELNLFYFEKFALEKSGGCDIIGIRLFENRTQLFARHHNLTTDWVLKSVAIK